MKNSNLFYLLVVTFVAMISFSCESSKTLSETEKVQIKGEIKKVVNTMFKGCEEANFTMTIESFLDSPDFVFLTNGITLSYKDFVNAVKPLFDLLSSQKVTIVDEKYTILDRLTVLYTANCKFLENYKDGHSSLNDPTAILCIYKKINNEWKTIYAVESYVKKNIENISKQN